jgi:hypothetical protein
VTVLLSEKAFGEHFADHKRRLMDIKRDVLMMSVLFRPAVGEVPDETAPVQELLGIEARASLVFFDYQGRLVRVPLGDARGEGAGA